MQTKDFNTKVKTCPTREAMISAKEFLNPLPGDVIQLAECKELARIIDKYMQPKTSHDDHS
jgi:hypothetical protein